jgi:general stress protein YciG
MTEAIIQRAKSRRGFASMSPERRREIASLGGKSIPAESRSFSKQRALASKAGQKGGRKSGAGGAHRPGTIGTSAAVGRKEKPRLLCRTGGAQKGEPHKVWLMANRPYLDEG